MHSASKLLVLYLPGVTNKVCGDHIIFSVTKDSFQLALRLLPAQMQILNIIEVNT